MGVKMWIPLLLVLFVDKSFTESIDCSRVECPQLDHIQCPSDSVSHLDFPPDLLKLLHADEAITDYKNNFTSDSRQRRAVAYKRHESIKIVPGGGDIHKRSIPENFSDHESTAATTTTTTEPTNHTEGSELLLKCCPRRVCVCLSTSCNLNCHPPSVLVEDIDSTPGKCCESFKCVSPNHCKSNQKIYSNGTQWKEQDNCTDCECINGKVTCSTSLCKPLSCLNKKQVSGECCPICDYANTNFCVGDEWCDKVCKHGYRKSESGCSLCKCARDQSHFENNTTNTKAKTEPSSTVAVSTTTEKTTTPTTVVPVSQIPVVQATNPIISCPDHLYNQYYFVIGCGIVSILISLLIGLAFYYCLRSSRQRYRVVNSADSLNIK